MYKLFSLPLLFVGLNSVMNVEFKVLPIPVL